MRRREELDDPLHALRQLPDRNVDAHHEADDRADDRARNRERIVALKERNEEQHQRRVRERREQNQREDFDQLHAVQQRAAAGGDVQLAEHERNDAHNHADHERAEDVAARNAHARQGGGADVLDDLLRFVLNHGAKRAHRGGHGRNRDEPRDDPTIHQVARAGDILHAARPHIPEEQRIHADDDEHGQQREEHGRLVLKEHKEVALHKVNHSRISFPVMAINASSIVPVVTVKDRKSVV